MILVPHLKSVMQVYDLIPRVLAAQKKEGCEGVSRGGEMMEREGGGLAARRRGAAQETMTGRASRLQDSGGGGEGQWDVKVDKGNVWRRRRRGQGQCVPQALQESGQQDAPQPSC